MKAVAAVAVVAGASAIPILDIKDVAGQYSGDYVTKYDVEKNATVYEDLPEYDQNKTKEVSKYGLPMFEEYGLKELEALFGGEKLYDAEALEKLGLKNLESLVAFEKLGVFDKNSTESLYKEAEKEAEKLEGSSSSSSSSYNKTAVEEYEKPSLNKTDAYSLFKLPEVDFDILKQNGTFLKKFGLEKVFASEDLKALDAFDVKTLESLMKFDMIPSYEKSSKNETEKMDGSMAEEGKNVTKDYDVDYKAVSKGFTEGDLKTYESLLTLEEFGFFKDVMTPDYFKNLTKFDLEKIMYPETSLSWGIPSFDKDMFEYSEKNATYKYVDEKESDKMDGASSNYTAVKAKDEIDSYDLKTYDSLITLDKLGFFDYEAKNVTESADDYETLFKTSFDFEKMFKSVDVKSFESYMKGFESFDLLEKVDLFGAYGKNKTEDGYGKNETEKYEEDMMGSSASDDMMTETEKNKTAENKGFFNLKGFDASSLEKAFEGDYLKGLNLFNETDKLGLDSVDIKAGDYLADADLKAFAEMDLGKFDILSSYEKEGEYEKEVEEKNKTESVEEEEEGIMGGMKDFGSSLSFGKW